MSETGMREKNIYCQEHTISSFIRITGEKITSKAYAQIWNYVKYKQYLQCQRFFMMISVDSKKQFDYFPINQLTPVSLHQPRKLFLLVSTLRSQTTILYNDSALAGPAVSNDALLYQGQIKCSQNFASHITLLNSNSFNKISNRNTTKISKLLRKR